MKKAVCFLSYYVFYVGSMAAYYTFLDVVFCLLTEVLLEKEMDKETRKQCIIVNTYIYMLNVVKRNITTIRISKKEPFNSDIENLLQKTELVTTDQCRKLKDRMTACKELESYVEIFEDFYNEMKNTLEGRMDWWCVLF